MQGLESRNTSSVIGELPIHPGDNADRAARLPNARNFRISLKQWKMFHAVVDFDGFTGAATHLHISQSAISYALAKLQEQLGVPLFRIEGRKARVTEEGRILLERSRDLIKNALELEALAESLRQGWGPEIRLSVDPGFPSQLLMRALRKLSSLALHVRLAVEELKPEQAKRALYDKTVDLMIASQVPNGFIGEKLIEIEYIAVAHPEHPLFSSGPRITSEDLEKHLRIVISGAENHLGAEGEGARARLWTVSDFDTAVGALRNCLGYAWLPSYRVQRLLKEGQIRQVPMAVGGAYKTSLYLICGRSFGTASGAKRFAEALFEIASCGPLDEN